MIKNRQKLTGKSKRISYFFLLQKVIILYILAVASELVEFSIIALACLVEYLNLKK